MGILLNCEPWKNVLGKYFKELHLQMHWMSILRFCRPLNLFGMTLTIALVYNFALPSSKLTYHENANFNITVLILAVVCIGAAGYLVNDIYDTAIDKINHPDKKLLLETFTMRTAWLIYGSLTLLGLALSFVLGKSVFSICFITALLLWFYAYSLKRIALLGNLLIASISATMVALPLIAMDASYSEYKLIAVYIVFCFFISLARELIKDMEDVEGDNSCGCRTLPVITGVKATKGIVIFVLMLLATLVSYYALISILEKRLYFCTLVLLPMVAVAIIIVTAKVKNDYTYASKMCKFIMFAGLGSMLLI